MDERPSDAGTPDHAEPPVEYEELMGDDDAPAGVEPPDYVEPPLDEPPIDLEPPEDAGLLFDEPLVDLEPSDYDEYFSGVEPPASFEQFDYGDELPMEAGAPTVDLAQAEVEPQDTAEPADAEPPASLEQIDYGDELPMEAEAPTVDPAPAEVEPQDYAEPASVEPPAYAEPPPDAEIPDYTTALLVDEGPSGAVLYQAFVPRRMRRDRLAAMSYPSAIEMVSRRRKKGDPAELGELDMGDEEIAAAIQDYARGIDTEEDRANWLLGQILEEQQRQTRHLRGVKTVLILLIAALALAAIASCVLMFVQLPNLGL